MTWNILVATDLSDDSDEAAEYTLQLARDVGASVHLLVGASEAEAEAGGTDTDASVERLRTWTERFGLYVPIVRASINEESASQEVVRYAHDKDVELIVVGLPPGGLKNFFLGDRTVYAILDTAPCPVTVIRSGHRGEGLQ